MSQYDRELTERARAIKRKKKRRKVMIARLITLLIIIALIAGGFLIVRKFIGNDGYDDQSSFEKYANEYYDSFDGDKQIGESRAEYKYGEPVSIAIDKPKLNEDAENQSISDFLKGKADSFKVENQSLGKEEQAALLIGYESFETPEKAESVAMHERQIFNAAEDNQEISVDTVKCFNFSTKNGMTMMPSNMLKGDYESYVKKRIKDSVADEYKDNVKDLDVSNFIMTGEGFRFFADGGKLAPKEEGVQHFDLSYDDMKNYMQDDIGENVIDPTKPMVAITYDDGPDENLTPVLLDTYEKNHAVCTFFELGQNVKYVEGADKLLKRELELGCEVGTHSWDHPNLFALSDDQIKQQAEKSKNAIKEACGKEPTVFRAPYGNGNDHIAKIFGLPGFNWSVDTLDWKTLNKDAIMEEVKRFGNLDGQIILMHSIHKPSIEATKELLPYLKKKGYQFVTVTQLMQYKYSEAPLKIKYYGYTFGEVNGGAQQ
jgi:peptidoglycan/xylan/chitin deacetylase (PgdA/CDA1 family)